MSRAHSSLQYVSLVLRRADNFCIAKESNVGWSGAMTDDTEQKELNVIKTKIYLSIYSLTKVTIFEHKLSL